MQIHVLFVYFRRFLFHFWPCDVDFGPQGIRGPQQDVDFVTCPRNCVMAAL